MCLINCNIEVEEKEEKKRNYPDFFLFSLEFIYSLIYYILEYFICSEEKMPRKSKDKLDIPDNEEINTTKTSTKKANRSKKVAVNTKVEKKSTSIETNKSTNKKNTSVSTTKATSKSPKKNKSSKTVASKKSTKIAKPVISNVEYYDLPYRYNETVVKILAQTPTTLFIYWDVSDKDRELYIEKYGEDFFSTTKPILIITNKTMNYTFEVEINDFANSWYLHLNDADCDYSVELGRRPIYSNKTIDNYIYVSTSNDMEMPNNHILFDKLGKSVFFKNVKNNFIEEREISSITFMKNIGKVYNIYEIYKDIYKDELEIEELDNARLNPSSNSSKFK